MIPTAYETEPSTRPIPEWIVPAVIAAVVIGLIVWAVASVSRADARHEHWRQVTCAEMATATPDQLWADASHLDSGPTRTAAFAYATTLARYGPSSVVVQKAYADLARACAA